MPWNGVHNFALLPNGNLLTQGKGLKSICEIDREKKEIVWRYHADKSNGNEGKRIEARASATFTLR